MNRIIKIGMNVHSKNYTLCAMEPTIRSEDRIFGKVQVALDYKSFASLNLRRGNSVSTINIRLNVATRHTASFIRFITSSQSPEPNVIILSPTAMLTPLGQCIKTDKRDAHLIAQCLCYGGYHPFYISTGKDDAVKENLWMRDDHKLALKKLAQQINAFVLRHGQSVYRDEMDHQACHLAGEIGTRSDISGNPERIYCVL